MADHAQRFRVDPARQAPLGDRMGEVGMTPAVRPSVTDDARAEADRRWGDRRTSDRLPMDWLDEGMASGFVLGAQWAAGRAETTTEATERIARQIAATSAMTGRDALDLVEAVQALQNAETTADLHWSNAAAAEGWDKCVKSLRYEDGSPVEIVEVANPYRKMLEGLDAKEDK